MSKLHIKKGDTVYVNSGNCKGQTGKVLQVLVKEQRAIVEGINMVSKSQKPSAKYPHLREVSLSRKLPFKFQSSTLLWTARLSAPTARL